MTVHNWTRYSKSVSVAAVKRVLTNPVFNVDFLEASEKRKSYNDQSMNDDYNEDDDRTESAKRLRMHCVLDKPGVTVYLGRE